MFELPPERSLANAILFKTDEASCIGGITFTGSIVAFLKLAGRMSSRPTILPGRHLINSSLLAANAGTMGAFLTMAPGAPAVAAVCLSANTVLSFAKGFTTTAAIGGADMRMAPWTTGMSVQVGLTTV